MELTVNNIIKIIIAVFVIVVLVFGIYLGVKSYIIPYFTEIGPSGDGSGGNGDIGGGVDVCNGKTEIGYIDNNFIYILDKGKYKETNFYIDGDNVKEAKPWYKRDSFIGRINGIEIEIFDSEKTDENEILDKAIIGGNQICNEK